MRESVKILVLGNSRQALTVIRSLAKTGYGLIVGRSGDEKKYLELSRYVSEVWVHPPIAEVEKEFANDLVGLLNQRKDIHYVFPVDEDDIEYLEKHVDKLFSLTTMVMLERSLFFRCIDKQDMYKTCASVGIPIPETKVVRSLKELNEVAKTLGYPIIAKPNDGYKFFFDNKAIICNTPEELNKVFSSWPPGNEFIMLQKYVNGYRHNCHFFSINGVIRLYFEHRTIRTDRINGTGLGVDNETVKFSPLLQDYCTALINKLGYSGVGCVQFLVRNDGQGYFLELNPRLDANCAIPFKYGYDFPRLAFEYAEGLDKFSLPLMASYRIGQRANWLMGDIEGINNEIRRGSVNSKIFTTWFMKMCKSLISADYHITWSWRDPLPTIFAYYKLLARLVGRLKRKINRGKDTQWRFILFF